MVSPTRTVPPLWTPAPPQVLKISKLNNRKTNKTTASVLRMSCCRMNDFESNAIQHNEIHARIFNTSSRSCDTSSRSAFVCRRCLCNADLQPEACSTSLIAWTLLVSKSCCSPSFQSLADSAGTFCLKLLRITAQCAGYVRRDLQHWHWRRARCTLWKANGCWKLCLSAPCMVIGRIGTIGTIHFCFFSLLVDFLHKCSACRV